MAKSSVLTVADLEMLPDDGMRYELLDGELLVSPGANSRHQSISPRLAAELIGYLRERGGGRLFMDLDVVFEDRTLFRPDLIVVGEHQEGIITAPNVKGVPMLVIEILSDARRDRIIKHQAYQHHGVPEYWIVDPESEWVEVYRLDGDAYGRPTIFRTGDTMTTDSLPGLRIDVADLFADLLPRR